MPPKPLQTNYFDSPMPNTSDPKYSVENLKEQLQELKGDVKELRGDFFEKVSEIHARISNDSNKIATLAALWSVLSLVMVFTIYKLFEVTAMLSKVLK
jgi:hypothetical protein